MSKICQPLGSCTTGVRRMSLLRQSDLAEHALLQAQVAAQAADLDHELAAFASPNALCQDFDQRCDAWAAQGQCKTNEGFLKYECRVACRYCEPATGHVLTVRGQYY